MIKQISGIQVHQDPQLLKDLIELDKLNMEPILRASGFFDFPLEKRIQNLKRESTEFFGAFKENFLLGYLEVCRDWNDPQDIYLSSIQIQPAHQGTAVFKSLISSAYKWVDSQNFKFLTSNVQIANKRMLKIFKQIGFEILDGVHPNTKQIRGELTKIKQNNLFKRLVRYSKLTYL